MRGDSEEFPGRGERKQETRVSLGGKRLERPLQQLRLDELLDLDLPPDRRVRACEGCEQLAVIRTSRANPPAISSHSFDYLPKRPFASPSGAKPGRALGGVRSGIRGG
jgi:hypothetical protein